ncbi:hypothetical protein [Peterkaempfera griseoplana]|uniref:hypothetical protein n=1 Tax=Peterkaempfera griseoplana TaxID=66896 RepID=UPI0006E150F8|nr:hypothetical protein [Peterkaempfera griseoplana]
MPRASRSILLTAALASSAALGLTGCSSDGGGSDTATPSAAVSTPASAPASASAPVSASASAPASASASTPAAGSAGGSAKPLTKAQLNGAALTAADLPPDFRVSTPSADNALFASDTDTAEPASCQPVPDIAASDGAIRPTATADRDYQSSAMPGQGFYGRIAAYRAGDAEKAMARLHAALKTCTFYRSRSGDAVTEVRIRTLQAPAVGDDSVMFQLSGTTAGRTLDIRMTEVRVGSSVAVFAGVSQSGTGSVPIPTQLMTLQADKLRAASGS